MARELKPCGTNAAYTRHIRRGEKPCDSCRKARVAYMVGWRAGMVSAYTPARCGTYGGYASHYRCGETPCQPCRDAASAYRRAWRAAQKAVAS